MLNEIVTPLAVAYVWQMQANWQAIDWERLEQILATSMCDNPHYRADIVKLACRMRASQPTLVSSDFVMPPYRMGYEPSSDSVSAINSLAMHITSHSTDVDAVALYMHSIANVHAAALSAEPAHVYENMAVTAIVRGFSLECKFKRTGDLFIHTIIKLRVPAWLTAAHATAENPFAVASKVHTDRTNATIQPLIKNDVRALLDLLQAAPLELFCVYAALAIELIPEANCCILTNSQVLMAEPGVPVLAVVTSFEIDGVTDACGYMSENVFYHTKDPIAAIAAFAVAAAETCPLAKHAVAGIEVVLDSPLSKFIQ